MISIEIKNNDETVFKEDVIDIIKADFSSVSSGMSFVFIDEEKDRVFKSISEYTNISIKRNK